MSFFFMLCVQTQRSDRWFEVPLPLARRSKWIKSARRNSGQNHFFHPFFSFRDPDHNSGYSDLLTRPWWRHRPRVEPDFPSFLSIVPESRKGKTTVWAEEDEDGSWMKMGFRPSIPEMTQGKIKPPSLLYLSFQEIASALARLNPSWVLWGR